MKSSSLNRFRLNSEAKPIEEAKHIRKNNMLNGKNLQKLTMIQEKLSADSISRKDMVRQQLLVKALGLSKKKTDILATIDLQGEVISEMLSNIGSVILEGNLGRAGKESETAFYYNEGTWGSYSSGSVCITQEEDGTKYPIWVDIKAWDIDLRDYGPGACVRVVGTWKLNEFTNKKEEFRQKLELVIESFEPIQAKRGKRSCRIIKQQENRYENNPASAMFRSEAEIQGLVDDGVEAEPLGITPKA